MPEVLDSLDSPSSFTVRSMSLSTFALKGTVAGLSSYGTEVSLPCLKEKIKANDLKKVKAVIDENADLIIKRWEEGILIVNVGGYIMKITKIWFNADHIFGRDEEGKEYSQSLLWYPKLRANIRRRT